MLGLSFQEFWQSVFYCTNNSVPLSRMSSKLLDSFSKIVHVRVIFISPILAVHSELRKSEAGFEAQQVLGGKSVSCK